MSGAVLLGGQVDRIGGGIAGGLVRVPITNTAWTPYQAGTATATLTGLSPDNPDGSQVKIVMLTPSGAGNHSVVRAEIEGPTVGVRYARDDGVTAPPNFDVVIDGVPYPVNDSLTRRNNVVTTPSNTDREGRFVVTGLGEGMHTVEVHLTAGSADRRLEFFGFLAEAGRGYFQAVQRTASCYPLGGTTLTTAFVAIPYINSAVALLFRTTSASVKRVVAITDNNGSSMVEMQLDDTGSATFRSNDGTKTNTARYVIPGDRFSPSGMKWKVDVGSDTKAWTVIA